MPVKQKMADEGAVLVGTAYGTGVTVEEHGDDGLHKTIFTLVDTPVVLADNAGVRAYGGVHIYALPAGVVLFGGILVNAAVTKSSAGVNADWDGDFGVGSVVVPAGGLATAGADILNAVATPQAVAGVTSVKTFADYAIGHLDGSTTPLDVYLNFMVDDADQDVTGTPANLILNGTVTLLWTHEGSIA